MVGDGELEAAKIEVIVTTDVPIVGPKTFFTALVGEFVDAVKHGVGSGRYFEPIAKMVAVGMGQYYEFGTHLVGGHRRCRIVIQEWINQQNQA